MATMSLRARRLATDSETRPQRKSARKVYQKAEDGNKSSEEVKKGECGVKQEIQSVNEGIDVVGGGIGDGISERVREGMKK